MDQRIAIFTALKKAIDLPTEEHLAMLIAMQIASMKEEEHAKERHDAILERATVLIAICAEAWECSYSEAIGYCQRLHYDSRHTDDGRDIFDLIPYAEYLKSAHWQGVRQYALLRADYRCQICNSSGRLDVHHRTYEGKGAEDYRDVIALCRDCHAKFHGKG